MGSGGEAGGASGHRGAVRALINDIAPLDALEQSHRAETLEWIDTGAPLCRTERPATPPRHLVAYSVVVDPVERAILLVDHRLAQKWLPPGGHIEPDELPADAARRELREELDLGSPFAEDVGGCPLMVTCTTTGGLTPGHVDVSLWHVFTESVETELRADTGEFNAVRWWPVDEIARGDPGRFDPNLPRFLAKLRA